MTISDGVKNNETRVMEQYVTTQGSNGTRDVVKTNDRYEEIYNFDLHGQKHGVNGEHD